MKPIILTSIIAFFLSINIHANDPVKVYTNTETTEMGTIKECTFINSSTSKAEKKIAYEYNTEGTLLEKNEYEWNDNRGWDGVKKYEYQYNKDGKLANIIFTKWDDKTKAWSSTSEHNIYTYNANGELLSVKQVKVKNNLNDLVASK